MKWVKFSIVVFLMFLSVFGIANSEMVTHYIFNLKNQPVLNVSPDWEKIINSFAERNNTNPIEPKIDKIWKLIPGYNGLIVDKEATLKLARTNKLKTQNEIHYIWKEVEPRIQLGELGYYPIYRGNPRKPEVSFMVNVAWGTEHIDQILNIFKENQVKATFFLDGSWIKKNPDIARKIVAEGHELGNHAYSHPQMSRLSVERIKQEIVKTEELIFTITNQSSKYFAPPSGDFDQRVVDIAGDLHLQTVLWTLDTVDWKKPSPETIINRIIPKLDNGHLILMHPTKSTVEALPILIREAKKKGLKIGTVKETLSTKRILPVESQPEF